MKTELKGFILTVIGLGIVIALNYTVFKEIQFHLPKQSVSYTYEIQENGKERKETKDFLKIEKNTFVVYEHETKELETVLYENKTGLYEIKPQLLYEHPANWRQFIHANNQKNMVTEKISYQTNSQKNMKTSEDRKYERITTVKNNENEITYGKENFIIKEKNKTEEKKLINEENLLNMDDYLNEKFLQCTNRKQVVYKQSPDFKKIVAVPKDRFEDFQWSNLTSIEKMTAFCQTQK